MESSGRVRAGRSDGMPARAAEPTAAFAAPRGDETAPFVAGPLPAGRFDEELRRLLRSRLILAHLLGLVYVALLAVLSFLVPGADEDPTLRPDQGTPWLLVPLLAQCLAGAAALRGSARM